MFGRLHCRMKTKTAKLTLLLLPGCLLLFVAVSNYPAQSRPQPLDTPGPATPPVQPLVKFNISRRNIVDEIYARNRPGQPKEAKRRIFLDCGANIGSTYLMFHKIWPDPEQYEMLSFEIDRRLAPHYAGFSNHTAMVPLAVADKESTMTAHLETLANPDRVYRKRGSAFMQRIKSWVPSLMKPNSNGPSHWGGGSLFSFGKGEFRGLTVAHQIETFDLSAFIRRNVRPEDELVLKIDIEGAEYDVLRKMLDDNTFPLVDQFFLEFHDWQPTGWTGEQQRNLREEMERKGIEYGQWEAEYPQIPIAYSLNPPTFDTSRNGRVVTRCSGLTNEAVVGIAVGMNRKMADRLVRTVLAHEGLKQVKLGLFLYGDFLEEFPDQVKSWMETGRFILGVRGDHARPVDYSEKMGMNDEVNMMLLASLRSFRRHFETLVEYYLPDSTNSQLSESASEKFGLKALKNVVKVPAPHASNMNDIFFNRRSVEKTPVILKYLDGGLGKSDVVVLDADFEETWTSSVFLLDYLTSPLSSRRVVSFSKCG